MANKRPTNFTQSVSSTKPVGTAKPASAARPSSAARVPSVGPAVKVPARRIPGLKVPVVVGEAADENADPPFVAVFGRLAGEVFVEVLGLGELVDESLVLGSAEVNDLLAAGATPTSVGIAWVEGSQERVELIPIQAFGARNGADDEPDQSMWALELKLESNAFVSNIPEGASPASAWCFLFPWVSFCQKK